MLGPSAQGYMKMDHVNESIFASENQLAHILFWSEFGFDYFNDFK